MPERDYTTSELLAVMSARLLKDGQVVFAGVGIPLLAATLAQGLDCPGLTILFEGGVIGPVIEPGKLPPSTNEQRCTVRANMVLASTDVLLLLQRGYIDLIFKALMACVFARDRRRLRVLDPAFDRALVWRRYELDPADAGEVDLRPHVGVPLREFVRRVLGRVLRERIDDVPRGHSGWHAQRAEHHCHR